MDYLDEIIKKYERGSNVSAPSSSFERKDRERRESGDIIDEVIDGYETDSASGGSRFNWDRPDVPEEMDRTLNDVMSGYPEFPYPSGIDPTSGDTDEKERRLPYGTVLDKDVLAADAADMLISKSGNVSPISGLPVDEKEPLFGETGKKIEKAFGDKGMQTFSGILGSAGAFARSVERLANPENERIEAPVNPGVLGTDGQLLKGIGDRDPYEKKNTIFKAAKATADFLEEGNEQIQKNLLQGEDPTFWDKVFNGIGSSAFFLVPGALAATGIATAAKFSPSVAKWLGAGVGGVMEGFADAGTTYKQVLDDGGDFQDANAAGSLAFWMNVPLDVITDKLGFFGDNKATKSLIAKSLSVFVKNPALKNTMSNVAGGMAGRGLNEMFQEGAQNPIQETLTEKALEKSGKGTLTWADAVKAMPEISERVPESIYNEGLPAFVSAAIFGLPTHMMQMDQEQRVEEEKSAREKTVQEQRTKGIMDEAFESVTGMPSGTEVRPIVAKRDEDISSPSAGDAVGTYLEGEKAKTIDAAIDKVAGTQQEADVARSERWAGTVDAVNAVNKYLDEMERQQQEQDKKENEPVQNARKDLPQDMQDNLNVNDLEGQVLKRYNKDMDFLQDLQRRREELGEQGYQDLLKTALNNPKVYSDFRNRQKPVQKEEPVNQDTARAEEIVTPEIEGENVQEVEKPSEPESIKKGEVGQKLGSGEVVLTSTGRKTTPFPKVDMSTNRKAANTVKRVDRWLIQNAINEAEQRGDEFNLLQFRGSLDNPSQADKDSAAYYLFDEEFIQKPDPKILKDMTKEQPSKSTDDIKPGDTVYRKDNGQALEVVNADDPSLLTVKHPKTGTQFQMGKGTVELAPEGQNLAPESIPEPEPTNTPDKGDTGRTEPDIQAEGQKRTIQDLQSLTFDTIEMGHWDKETEGVGKNKGIKYRTAKYAAIDRDGKERIFQVKVSSNGKTQVKPLGRTDSQKDADDQSEWSKVPEDVQRLVNLHWPDLNLSQKATIGKIAAGLPVNEMTANAVLGGSARNKMLELFPNIKTLEDGKRALQEYVRLKREEKSSDIEAEGPGFTGLVGEKTPRALESLKQLLDDPNAVHLKGRSLKYVEEDGKGYYEDEEGTRMPDWTPIPGNPGYSARQYVRDNTLEPAKAVQEVMINENGAIARRVYRDGEQEAYGEFEAEDNLKNFMAGKPFEAFFDFFNQKPDQIQAPAEEAPEAAQPELTDYQRQREENSKAADDVRTLQTKGQNSVPGVRIEAAEEAGRMRGLLESGEITQEEWDRYVQDLKNSGKVEAIEEKTPQTKPEEVAEPEPGVSILNIEKHISQEAKRLKKRGQKEDNFQQVLEYGVVEKNRKQLLDIIATANETNTQEDWDRAIHATEEYNAYIDKVGPDSAGRGKMNIEKMKKEHGKKDPRQDIRSQLEANGIYTIGNESWIVKKLDDGGYYYQKQEGKFNINRGKVIPGHSGESKSDVIDKIIEDIEGELPGQTSAPVPEKTSPTHEDLTRRDFTEGDYVRYKQGFNKEPMKIVDINKDGDIKLEGQNYYRSPFDVESVQSGTIVDEGEGVIPNEPERNVSRDRERTEQESQRGGQELPDGGDTEGGSAVAAGGREQPVLEDSGQRADEDVRGAEPPARDGVRETELSDETVGMEGQPATEDTGEELPWNRGNGLVPASARDDNGSTGSSLVSNNYDLRDKEPILLTKGERRRINDRALEILKKKGPLTDEEKDILRQYTGEGGLSSGTVEALNQHYTDYQTIRAIYEALERSGFSFKKALEPAVGSGNFVGNAPGGVDWTTVDIDRTNHEIASKLYPEATHYLLSYEQFKKSGFDLVISNVPFLQDRGAGGLKVRPDIQTLHDFYFVHSLGRAKDNGVVAFITSKGTMDKKNSSVRKEIVEKADVLGAFRLPGGHFEKNAHTSVITDIIFLQKRPEGAVPSREQKAINDSFVNATETRDGIVLNNYYHDRMDSNFLGSVEIGKDKARFGQTTYTINGQADLSRIDIGPYRPYKIQKKEKAAPESVDVDEIPRDSKDFQKWASENDILTRQNITRTGTDREGNSFEIKERDPGFSENIIIESDAVYAVDKVIDFEDVSGSAKIYREVPYKERDRIKDLDWIRRDAASFQETSDPKYAESGKKLIESYRQIHKVHPKKDKKLRKIFKDAGEQTLFAELSSFFDEDFNPAPVLDIQTRYSDSGRAEVTDDSPLSIRAFANEDNKGIVDISKAEYLSMDELGELLNHGYSLVSMDDGGAVIQNDVLYYSGNIYTKIEEAERVKRDIELGRVDDEHSLRDKLDEQIRSLDEIRPTPKTIDDISFKGNENWLLPIIKKYGIWDIDSSYDRKSGKIQYEATNARGFPDSVYSNYLNNNVLIKRDFDQRTQMQEPISSYLSRMREAEEHVTEIVESIKARIKNDGQAMEEIEYAYNSKFRAYVKPNYSRAQYLIQDVLNEIESESVNPREAGQPIRLRKNQIEWIIQAVYEGKGINAHDVGGGKTFASIALARVLKKRGIAHKPLFVVPAKTINKWERDIRTLFPKSRVLNLGQLSKDKRTEQLFELANNNFDYVVISHEGFKSIKLPLDLEMKYFDDVVNEHVDDPDMKGSQAARNMEKIEKYRTVLKEAERDSRLTFDKLGIDAIIADEAHAFKNIGIRGELNKFGLGAAFGFSNRQKNRKDPKTGKIMYGENGKPLKEDSVSLMSSKSYDFRFKSNWIIENNNNKNVFLLTATPTPNKPMEIYTMLRHLGKDIFDEYGLGRDIDFSNNFFHLGTVQKPDDPGQTKNVLSAIINALELRGILNRYVDKISIEDMPWIKIPEAKEYRQFLDMSEEYRLIAEDLAERQTRAESGRKGAGEDNIIAIYSGGRAASVDPRLYGGEHANVEVDVRSYDPGDDKIQWTIESVAEVAKKNRKAGQLIFLDKVGWEQIENEKLAEDMHSEIKSSLVDMGFKEKEIAIINGKYVTNPKTGREVASGDKNQRKQDIADMYNEGKVKVVIGSTDSMGEGMDLQVKTTDIYHLDIPWTPGGFRQRNGRGLRFGNENDSVNIHYLLMRGTFDAISMDVVMHKKGWNEALYDKEDADVIPTAEEMAGGAIPPREQLLIELETDPIKKQQLILSFDYKRMQGELGEYNQAAYRIRNRISTAREAIKANRLRLQEREQKLRESSPNEKIKDEKKRKEQHEKSKAFLRKGIETSKRKIQEIEDKITTLEKTLDELGEKARDANERISRFEESYLDEEKNFRRDVIERLAATEDNLDNSPAPDENSGTDTAEELDPDEEVTRRINEAYEEKTPPAGASIKFLRPDALIKALDSRKKNQDVNDFFVKKDKKKKDSESDPRTFEFTDKEMEKAHKAYSRGIDKESTWSKLLEAFMDMKNRSTRTFRHLPGGAPFAVARHVLLQLKRTIPSAQMEAEEKISAVLTKDTQDGVQLYDRTDLDLFTRKVYLEDFARDAREGLALPVGYTEENVNLELQRLNEHIRENAPWILDSYHLRTEMWRKSKKEYIRQAGRAGTDMSKKFTKGDSYFRHQVLAHMMDQGRSIYGTGNKLKSPVTRGFLKERKGSELPINLNYAQAEFEVLAQTLADTHVWETIAIIDENYSITDRLKKMAVEMNNNNFKGLMEELVRIEQGVKTVDEDVRHEAQKRINKLSQKQAIALSRLSELAAMGELPTGPKGQFSRIVQELGDYYMLKKENKKDDVDVGKVKFSHKELMKYLSWLSKQEGDGQETILSRTFFKGVAEKKKAIKATLKAGDIKEVNWKDLVPDDYTIYQPREGSVFYKAYTIPEQMAESIASGLLTGLDLTPNQVKAVLARGPRHKEMCIPTPLAATLEELNPMGSRKEGPFSELYHTGIRTLKKFWLYGPTRWVKYAFRNLTGDSEAVVLGRQWDTLNPKHLKRATWELYQAVMAHRKPSKEFKDWAQMGGFMTFDRIQELGELKALERLQHLEVPDERALSKIKDKTWDRYWRAIDKAEGIREGVLRYASYLSYLEQMENNENGEPNNFGASNRDEIMALPDKKWRAFRLSNTLLGGYDELTETGEWMRNNIWPFWSFQEINLKRYFWTFKNAYIDGRTAGKAGEAVMGSAIKSSPFIAMRIGTFAIRASLWWAAMQAFNRWRWPEEEEKLPEHVKSRPHLIVGKNDAGEVKVMTRLGLLPDLLEWFGEETPIRYAQEWLNGNMSIREVGEEMAFGVINKTVSGTFPFLKFFYEMSSGRSTFPDVRRQRQIRDKWEYLYNWVGLGDFYRVATDLPDKGWGDLAERALSNKYDPMESSYWDTVSRVYEWKEEVLGQKGQSYYESPKSQALYYYKKAIRYGDKEAAKKYLFDYFRAGGTVKGYEQSMRWLNPLAGLAKKYWGVFYSSLDEKEQEAYKRAMAYYQQLIDVGP